MYTAATRLLLSAHARITLTRVRSLNMHTYMGSTVIKDFTTGMITYYYYTTLYFFN